MSPIIKELQDQVLSQDISIEDLKKQCDELGLSLHEDVLSPIGYNVCDRCGEYGEATSDFLWVDTYNWNRENPKDRAILKGIESENVDYCAICQECVENLRAKGELWLDKS